MNTPVKKVFALMGAAVAFGILAAPVAIQADAQDWNFPTYKLSWLIVTRFPLDALWVS